MTVTTRSRLWVTSRASPSWAEVAAGAGGRAALHAGGLQEVPERRLAGHGLPRSGGHGCRGRPGRRRRRRPCPPDQARIWQAWVSLLAISWLRPVHRGGEFPGARTWLGVVRGRGRSAEAPRRQRRREADDVTAVGGGCRGHHEGHEHGVSRVVMFAQDRPYGLERVVGGVEDRWQAAGFAQAVLCADDAVHVTSSLPVAGIGSVAARAGRLVPRRNLWTKCSRIPRVRADRGLDRWRARSWHRLPAWLRCARQHCGLARDGRYWVSGPAEVLASAHFQGVELSGGGLDQLARRQP